MAHKYLHQLTNFIDRLCEHIDGNVNLECKHFFSGAALYVNNNICITLTPVGLGIKLPQHTRVKLLADNKAVPLQYFPQGPVKKDYVLLPDGLNSARDEPDQYVRESINYVLTLPDPERSNKPAI